MRYEQEQFDVQTAEDVMDAIRRDQPEIADRISVDVHCGRVTLLGNVGCQQQRNRAEATARLVRGVVNVANRLVAQRCADPADIRELIKAAFVSSARLDSSRISVRVDGSDVVLTGQVRSQAEWMEAQRVALSAAGVTRVQNEITVGP